MTVKATIKRVTFRFNGTDDLSGLKVIEINNKVYPDEESKPLWGVERSNLKLRNVNPLWGLISSPDQGNISLHTLRQESLYLSGFSDGSKFSSKWNVQNLSGVGFYSEALGTLFDLAAMSPTDLTLIPNYSGKMNLDMYRRLQDLSRSAESTAKILKLIWTDLSANAVVGTRGLHGAIMQGYSSSSVSGPLSNAPAVNLCRDGSAIAGHMPFPPRSCWP